MRTLRAVVLACAVALLALSAAAVASAAHKSKKNPNVVTDTVYDGEYGESQNTWSVVQVQFAVSAGDQVTAMAPAAAFCAPPGQFKYQSAKIENDEFTEKAALAGDFHVTVTGHFEKGGHAKGEGVLQSVTIEGEPCREVGHWTAKALPKGTKLCPAVEPDLVVDATATGMTCAKAKLAYNAGVREANKNMDPNAPFDSPGYTCTQPSDDPDVRTLCTRGAETFRLP